VALTDSIDAALGFVCRSPYLAAGFVEDVLLALGLQVEAQCGPGEAGRIVAAAIAALPAKGRVPADGIVDTLLDLRAVAARPSPVGLSE
jgi:hypothetical protein